MTRASTAVVRRTRSGGLTRTAATVPEGTPHDPNGLCGRASLATAAVVGGASLVALVLAERADAAWAWPNSLQIATSAIAVWLSTVLAARRPRAATILLALGCTVWWIADMIGMAFGALDLIDDHHRIFEVTYLAGQALWMAAAFASIRRSQPLTSARQVADGVLFALIVLFGLYTAIGWAPSSPDGWYATATLAVDGAYVAFAFLAARSHRRPFRRMATLTAISAAILLAADTTFLYGLLQGSLFNFWIVDLGWTFSSVVRCAAIALALSAPRLSGTADPSHRPARLVLPAALLGAAALAVAAPAAQWQRTQQVVASLMLLVVGAREALVWRQIRDLEISELAARSDLERRARLDDLTGLLRRGQVFDRLAASLEAGESIAVAYVDLNEFSAINDTFGHPVGDRVLIATARALEQVGVTGRIGGDEFVVIGTPGPAGDGRPLHQAITNALREPLHVGDGAAVRIVPSVGVVVPNPLDGSSPEEIVARADHFAYVEKGGFARSRSAKHRRTTPRVDLADVVEPLDALRSGLIVPWFQPIVDLRTGLIAGAESLLRMIPAGDAPINAGSFVPALQSAGYAEDLTRLAIGGSFERFAPLVERHGWFLTVNLGERDLSNHATLDILAEALRSTGLDPSVVVAEVSEQIAPNGPLLDVLDSIHRLGIGIALDDFGAGSSTFGQITGLAPSFLKLDIGLTPLSRDEQIGMHSAVLVEAFTRLAHHLDMKVVVEGIETEHQRDIVRDLGCDYAQGYLWADAVPAGVLATMAERPHPEIPLHAEPSGTA